MSEQYLIIFIVKIFNIEDSISDLTFDLIFEISIDIEQSWRNMKRIYLNEIFVPAERSLQIDKRIGTFKKAALRDKLRTLTLYMIYDPQLYVRYVNL